VQLFIFNPILYVQKIYHLASCSTCKRIINELNPNNKTVFQDIKTEKITSSQLEEMASITGSYESLFSRAALKYKSMGLKEKNLSEQDYKNLILEEYTFLKRP
jgi:arsenate reductase